MNRIETLSSPVSSAVEKPAPHDSIKTLDLADGLQQDLLAPPLATFAPVHYEPGYAYPLLVWLHGANQSEHDLPEVMSHVSTRNYVAVAPGGVGGEGSPWPQTAAHIADTEQAVADGIAAAEERFNIHPERVFLAGVGEGGEAAMRIALAHPDQFAGVTSFDGGAPSGYQPLRNLRAVRGLSIMLSTAQQSERYPESRLCEDLRLLYTAGCTLSVHQEPGDGYLTTSMLAELDRWMMQLVCGNEPVSR